MERHYGKGIINKILDSDTAGDKLYIKVYEGFIEAIDGIDNGVPQYATDVKQSYSSNTNLSSRVSCQTRSLCTSHLCLDLNPDWMDENPNPDGQFQLAMALTGSGKIHFSHPKCISNELQSSELLSSATENLGSLPEVSSRRLFKIASMSMSRERSSSSRDSAPGRNTCTRSRGKSRSRLPSSTSSTLIKAVLGKIDERSIVTLTRRVQCVGVEGEEFQNRKSLPWKGLRDDDLSKASGIPGGIFVHISGFIGGNKTKEGALQMAKKALGTVEADDSKKQKVHA